MSKARSSELYKGSDGGLYEIISSDSDCALLNSFETKRYMSVLKPYFDKAQNMIDFTSFQSFDTLKEATEFQQKFKELLQDIKRVKKLDVRKNAHVRKKSKML
ncbi:MAG: hypothetical protein LUE12_03425 [Ruminococcus sp.]|nr:hypothetical protein [Ruminococcus sp.]MCD8095163.1 hypothetical protein [Ruminococcus sp.]